MPSTTRTVNVGLIGLGTVGGGVARVIARHHDEYLSAYGIDLRLKMASALEPERAAELGIAPEAFTTDWHDVVADPEIDIVIELITLRPRSSRAPSLPASTWSPPTRRFWAAASTTWGASPHRPACRFAAKRPRAAASPS